MGNHIHLLMQPADGENLSRIMQWFLGCFAQAWNREKGLSGHFWGGRFWSRPITTEEDLARVFDYIAQNPVKAGEVKKPADWKYSGVRYYKAGKKHIIDPPQKYKHLFEGY
jgi:putative transposase